MTPEAVLRFVWIAWAVSWVAAASWSDRTVKRIPAGIEVAYRLLLAAGYVLMFGLYPHRVASEGVLWTIRGPLEWVLVAAAAAGFMFTWWARVHLGRLWSSTVTQKEGHRIIDTGPYGLVRHPIYTGILFASLSTFVLRGTAAAAAGVALLTTGFIVKAKLEEGLLRDQLGHDQYAAYARRVRMIVPFVI